MYAVEIETIQQLFLLMVCIYIIVYVCMVLSSILLFHRKMSEFRQIDVFTYHAHIHNNLYANHKQKQLLNCLYLNSIHSKMGYISQYLVIVSTVVTLTDTVQM